MRTTTIGTKDAYPFVCSWNGSNSNTATGLKVSAKLKEVVISQIGSQAAALFESDFVNYNSGCILCQNIPDNLNIIFASNNATVQASFLKTIRFIVVRMPSTFKGQKGNLSSDYQYGERLRASVSLESSSTIDAEAKKGLQIPTINGSAVKISQGPIRGKNAAGIVYMIYRDANLGARTLKSQSGGGGGIGVWS